MSNETKALTLALKGDSKIQGDWGEMILENILEGSGLTKNVEYFTQETLRDENGEIIKSEDSNKALRPDVIVRYPNNGSIIIDSKVSLTAYSKYIAAETENDKKLYAKEHLNSVRKHIQELSQKNYAQYVSTSPDFVLLFIPNEPAYTLVLKESASLWEEAYKKRIILINGTNLIAVLRMAQDMWQRDRQIKNVEEIVKKAGGLYDKFCSYSESLLDAEKKLIAATNSLDKAKKQLMTGKGNLISGLENLKEMGITSNKQIPLQLKDKEE